MIIDTDEHSTSFTAKVLVVDDQIANLDFIKQALTHLEVELFSCQSGQQALALAQKHDLCLILMDVNMPDMTGFEAATLIREQKSSATVPIIFMTEQGQNQGQLLKGYGSGAVDYLVRPIDEFILVNKVKVFVDLFVSNYANLSQLVYELMAVKSELEAKNKELLSLAALDPLTGLDNRRGFEKVLSQNIAKMRRLQGQFALLFIDLDNFKYLNDRHGHHFGDLVLKKVAELIINVCRKEDNLFRIGGDEFALVQNRFKDINDVAKKAKRIIDKLAGVYAINDVEFQIGCSVGIACYPFAGETEDDLIRSADVAMYRAKMAGKGQMQIFSKELSELYQKRRSIELSLRESLKADDHFYLNFQPIYDLKTMQMVKAEVLLRWHHPVLKEVRPDEFIAIAEDCGLIQKLGWWIMETSMKSLKQLQQQEKIPIQLAINLSPLQLSEENFVMNFMSLLSKHQVDVKQIELEITETEVMADEKKEIDILQEMASNGVNFSLDDFGTGHSSLIRLRKMPINKIKIDRSFVRDVHHDNSKAEIVKSVLMLAKCLNLAVVAEGIEEQQELDFLINNNCDCGQGYFFAKPMMLSELIAFYKGGSK